MASQRAHALISGTVQGVNFRAATRSQARELGLTGWVRNLPDGRVEAVFEGETDRLETMLAWCREGSPPARVKRVEVDWERPEGGFDGFSIRR